MFTDEDFSFWDTLTDPELEAMLIELNERMNLLTLEMKKLIEVMEKRDVSKSNEDEC